MFIYAVLILLPALALAGEPIEKLEDKLFTAMDADKDGKITKKEGEDYFMGMDADTDGKITKDEFKNAVDKLDPAFVGHEDALYKLLDRDMDGVANKADIDAIFTLGDSSKDMGIDKNEFHVIFNLVVTTVG